MKRSSSAQIIRALNRSRLEPYLAEVGGSETRALELYAWHGELTAATQKILGITEVVLRNAIDEQLQKWNSQQSINSDSWLLTDPARPLAGMISDKRADALRRAKGEARRRSKEHRRFGQAVCHDDVLAQVMFGMWKELIPNHSPKSSQTSPKNRNRYRMWNEALINAFPNADDPNGKKTYWRVKHLHDLRNRVSHMDSLLSVDVQARMKEAFALVRSIDPTVSEWLSSTNTVPVLLRSRPSVRE